MLKIFSSLFVLMLFLAGQREVVYCCWAANTISTKTDINVFWINLPNLHACNDQPFTLSCAIISRYTQPFTTIMTALAALISFKLRLLLIVTSSFALLEVNTVHLYSRLAACQWSIWSSVSHSHAVWTTHIHGMKSQICFFVQSEATKP